MTTTSPVIHSDPDILGGTPVFVGTRVPVRTLLDSLEAGDSLNEFLEDFPSVTREQAVAALQLAPVDCQGSGFVSPRIPGPCHVQNYRLISVRIDGRQVLEFHRSWFA